MVTNPMAQTGNTAIQGQTLQDQIQQQNLMDKVMGMYGAIASNPKGQQNNVNWLQGNTSGTSGGLTGQLANQMNAVTTPGGVGTNPAVMDQVMGNFQSPEEALAAKTYYGMLGMPLGIKPPTIGNIGQSSTSQGGTGAAASAFGNAYGASLYNGQQSPFSSTVSTGGVSPSNMYQGVP
jgi:hypothetical protein